jgi:hypothetical protein
MSEFKRVDEVNGTTLEIARVPRHNGKTMALGGGSEQAVSDGNLHTGL